jgi:hypothetical protein
MNTKEMTMNRRTTVKSTIAALGLAFAVCPAFGQHTGQISQGLVEDPSASLWTNNNRLIPMCWHELDQFPSAQSAQDAKRFVKITIQEQWIDRLNLNITWADCPTSGNAKHVRVKLRIGDGGSNGTTLLTGMATLSTAAQRTIPPPNDPPGLLMGFRSDWNQDDATRADFRSLIMHEFGHVLGFSHEQERNDGPVKNPCYREPKPASGGIKIGPADPESIMGWSYCSSALGVITLGDMRGARSLYDRRDLAIRGVLLAGKFRSQHDLNKMSGEDQRNTLITELTGRTNQPVGHYQSMDNVTLAGAGAVLVFLREAKIRTDEQIRHMSDDDCRNVLIVEIAAQTGLGSKLQALNNMDLVLTGLRNNGSYIRGVLLAGHFRAQHELNRMSADDQRNTLITELGGRTNQAGRHFQAMNDQALAGAGAVLVLMREAGIRTDAQLKAMSDDDQRNVLIVEIGAQTGLDRQLQSLNNMDLVRMAFGIYP